MLPILYQSPELILYSYPLLMGLGWGVAYQVFFALLDPHFSKLKAQILFWGIFICAWLGAKVLFYLTFPQDIPVSYLGQINFWTGGGFVFYGGFIGGFLFLLFYKFIIENLTTSVLKAILPAVAFGHAVGRVGCFLAGCCFGKPTDLFWGVFIHHQYRHPTQLIEAFGLFALGLYLLKSKLPGLFLGSRYLIGYGLLRLVVESLRGDIVRGEWGMLTPSQWISIALILAGLALISICKIKRLQPVN